MAATFIVCINDATRDLYSDVDIPGGVRGDSGTDLRFPESLTLAPEAITLVDLRVRVRCEINRIFVPYQIVPRSSISKTPLMLANSIGIIDAGYQGTLKVAIWNHGNQLWYIRRGESLFQLIRPDLVPVRVVVVGEDAAAFAIATARADGGFGSTD